MGVKKKLIKSVILTVVTVILGVSSVIGADKRKGIVR